MTAPSTKLTKRSAFKARVSAEDEKERGVRKRTHREDIPDDEEGIRPSARAAIGFEVIRRLGATRKFSRSIIVHELIPALSVDVETLISFMLLTGR